MRWQNSPAKPLRTPSLMMAPGEVGSPTMSIGCCISVAASNDTSEGKASEVGQWYCRVNRACMDSVISRPG
jgi:hypothetical protein